MLVNFQDLPDDARVWIYQSDRSFSIHEVRDISNRLNTFLTSWSSHGVELKSAFEIKYSRFIIIGLNQNRNNASGCSIDSLVHLILEFEDLFKVSLLDKLNVSYKHGAFVAYKNIEDFKKMAKAKSISKKTIVFNNLVQTKIEYLTNWEIPASDSWHARFFI